MNFLIGMLATGLLNTVTLLVIAFTIQRRLSGAQTNQANTNAWSQLDEAKGREITRLNGLVMELTAQIREQERRIQSLERQLTTAVLQSLKRERDQPSTPRGERR